MSVVLNLKDRIIDSVCLDTIAANAGDISWSHGNLFINGLSTPIPWSKRLSGGAGYKKIPSNISFDPRIINITINATVLNTGVPYRLKIFKSDTSRPNMLKQESVITTQPETYTVILTTATANACRDAFISAINSNPNSLVVASNGGAGIITLTGKSQYEADFTVIDVDSIASSIANAQTFAQTEGTYEICHAITGAGTPGQTYTTYLF